MVAAFNRIVAVCIRRTALRVMNGRVEFLEAKVTLLRGRNERWLNGQASDRLVKTLVAAEDQRFWSHRGVDIPAIVRAIYSAIFRRRLQGASTIEQQLVRTLTNDRKLTFGRKLREIGLACVVGDFLTKREVAILYLCCAYYGWRMNSLGEACGRMGLSAKTVGYHHSAELVARLKYPEPECASVAWRQSMERRATYIFKKARNGTGS